MKDRKGMQPIQKVAALTLVVIVVTVYLVFFHNQMDTLVQRFIDSVASLSTSANN